MQFSKFRLYLIGLTMGIADLVPGISGGTVAFMSGIYKDLLNSIKTLQLHSFRKIAWGFLLPLGSGIATAILIFAKLLCFLLTNYREPLFGLFFGLIAASTVTCAAQAKMSRPVHYIALLVGAALSFGLTLLPTQLFFGSSFIGIIAAGTLGTGAMLLPGISGSFLLQLIGVYPLVISALAMPAAPGALKMLLAMGIGISIGFIIFSRVISFLLASFPRLTLSILVGFMAGGLNALWPFGGDHYLIPAIFFVIGFFLVIYLEIRMKRLRR
jgi:putative membrane protein